MVDPRDEPVWTEAPDEPEVLPPVDPDGPEPDPPPVTGPGWFGVVVDGGGVVGVGVGSGVEGGLLEGGLDDGGVELGGELDGGVDVGRLVGVLVGPVVGSLVGVVVGRLVAVGEAEGWDDSAAPAEPMPKNATPSASTPVATTVTPTNGRSIDRCWTSFEPCWPSPDCRIPEHLPTETVGLAVRQITFCSACRNGGRTQS